MRCFYNRLHVKVGFQLVKIINVYSQSNAVFNIIMSNLLLISIVVVTSRDAKSLSVPLKQNTVYYFTRQFTTKVTKHRRIIGCHKACFI